MMKKQFLRLMMILALCSLSACHMTFNFTDKTENSSPSSAATHSSAESVTSKNESRLPTDSTVSENTSSEVPVPETSTNEKTKDYSAYLGIYRYNDEVIEVREVTDRTVSGIYVYQTSAGAYGSRELMCTVEKTEPFTVSELFQNGGSEKIYYTFSDNQITADYPDGWWENRTFIFVCGLDQTDRIDHPYYSGNNTSEHITNEKEHLSFYGIWIAASKDKADCEKVVSDMQKKGFAAAIYQTDDWSGLNSEHWYVVSAGEYASETEADNSLQQIREAGYEDAYVKYTGDWQG